jgi:hypothetical protein
LQPGYSWKRFYLSKYFIQPKIIEELEVSRNNQTSSRISSRGETAPIIVTLQVPRDFPTHITFSSGS